MEILEPATRLINQSIAIDKESLLPPIFTDIDGFDAINSSLVAKTIDKGILANKFTRYLTKISSLN